MYLFRANLTAEGAGGTMKEGGTARRDALAKTVEGMGGRLEAFYYAFGDTDVYAIAELPDHASAAALSLAISSSGAVGLSTTVLLSPEEVDEAKGKGVDYRPPGG